MPRHFSTARRVALRVFAVALLAGCRSAAGAGSGAASADVARVGDFDAKSGRFLKRARPGVARPVDSLPLSADRVWALMPHVYASLGMTPTLRDDKVLVTGVINIVVRRRLGGEAMSRALECGMDQFGAFADNYEIHLTVVSAVGATTAGSTLETRVGAWASPSGISSDVTCHSTGRLEDRIRQTLLALAASAGER